MNFTCDGIATKNDIFRIEFLLYMMFLCLAYIVMRSLAPPAYNNRDDLRNQVTMALLQHEIIKHKATEKERTQEKLLSEEGPASIIRAYTNKGTP